MANKKVTKMALIDVEMVEIMAHNDQMDTFRWQTASNLDCSLQISEGEKIELIVNGRLIAQKRAKDVVTGAQLEISDNVLIPEIISFIQGGNFELNENGDFLSYQAPLAGSEIKPSKFDFNVYTAQRDMAGDIVSYMKISFPNCTGKPIDVKLENGAFFSPSYTVVSAPNNGESAYTITAVEELPTLTVDEAR